MQCPLKWKFIYVDKLYNKPSKIQQRGTDIHKEIEEFYSKIEIVNTVSDKPIIKVNKKTNDNFLKFETKRIEGCRDLSNAFDEKYFFPLYQELKLEDKDKGIRGTVDAVYIHPKDDKLIVIDWKTGKYYKNEMTKYRLELAIYKELIEKNYGKEVGYWGIYFIDADKLFFEEVKQKHIDKMHEIIDDMKSKIEQKDLKAKSNFYCQYCNFQQQCLEEQKRCTNLNSQEK
jgi:CRISPR/Cas system-associated exonuclease Cas4 (RecB family)